MTKNNKALLYIIIAIIITLAITIPYLSRVGVLDDLALHDSPQSASNFSVTELDSNTVGNEPSLQAPQPTQQAVSPVSLEIPLSRATERVSKKPFGLYVSPKNSPVSPEKFTGYHTGVDFEVFPEEAEIDVPVYAICDGPLLAKRTAQGYGGVVVQRCELDKQMITVIYGHVRLSSVMKKIGDALKIREQFAVLGTGNSVETDGERKHLHLGIHKGSEVTLAGYEQNQNQLSNWIDIWKYLR